jgi:hypothetical protein
MTMKFDENEMKVIQGEASMTTETEREQYVNAIKTVAADIRAGRPFIVNEAAVGVHFEINKDSAKIEECLLMLLPFEKPEGGKCDLATASWLAKPPIKPIAVKGESKVKFELNDANCYTRWPCHLCGGHTEKVSILCEEAGADDKFRICEGCLERQASVPEYFDSMLEQHAAELEADAVEMPARLKARAAELRSLIGKIDAPSYSEWRVRAGMSPEKPEAPKPGRFRPMPRGGAE